MLSTFRMLYHGKIIPLRSPRQIYPRDAITAQLGRHQSSPLAIAFFSSFFFSFFPILHIEFVSRHRRRFHMFPIHSNPKGIHLANTGSFAFTELSADIAFTCFPFTVIPKVSTRQTVLGSKIAFTELSV